jgi:hypothetical protein
MRDTIDMAREAGFELDCASLEWHKRIKALVELARADEREACAKVVESHGTWSMTETVAAAIRAIKTTPIPTPPAQPAYTKGEHMTQDEIIEMAIQGHAGTRDAIRWAIKQALALDKKAENARELGLDYEPEERYTYGTPLLDAMTKENT